MDFDLDYVKFQFYNPQKETLYKYVDIESAIKILSNQTLKFSSPFDFNDPFELSSDFIDFNTTSTDLKNLINRKLDGKTRIEKRKFYKENLKNKQVIIPALKNSLEQIKANMGICCFSKQCDNPLLWSHYGDKHKGVCLGFKMDHTENVIIAHINYIKEQKKIRYWDENKNMFPAWACTKSHIWSYENEIRAIYLFQNGLIKFDSKCLLEIYYGLRTSSNNIEILENIISQKGYEIEKRHKIEMNPKEFNFKTQPFIKINY